MRIQKEEEEFEQEDGNQDPSSLEEHEHDSLEEAGDQIQWLEGQAMTRATQSTVWKSVPVVGKAAGVINQQKMKGCWKDEKEEE